MGLVVRGARVVTPGADLGVASVRCADGRIAAVGAAAAPRAGDEVIDATGLTLVPGFIDIHSHGRSGADFCDATDAAFATIARGKASDGVTGFLATGLTRPEEDLAALCRCAARFMAAPPPGAAACLGVHLEGPFFNAEMAGAQNPAYLRAPDAAFVERLHACAPVKKVSLAPELPGAEACIRRLVELGIAVSGGHSAADFATFERARAAGLSQLTHFCNAMLPIHHLRPSMVTGGLLADDVTVELICDGVHLSDPMIALIARMKGPERIILITDAMCAAGCPDGLYSLGGLRVRVAAGCARLADVPDDPARVVSNVAGSVALFPACFRRFVRVTGWPLEKALRAAALNAAESLGLGARGRVAAGCAADLAALDADLEPRLTVIAGRIAWRAQ